VNQRQAAALTVMSAIVLWGYKVYADVGQQLDSAADLATGDPYDVLNTSKISAMAHAIGIAEAGWNPTPDELPIRTNNPGDLRRDFGYGTDHGIGKFPTVADGERALENQLALIISGRSSAYPDPNITIADFAVKYTGNDNAANWAATVAQVLGVSVHTPLSAVLA
jgi:hypothetical protein